MTLEPKKAAEKTPPKKDKNKDILFIRHKLQKGFLSRDSPPKDEEMQSMANMFSSLEKNIDLEVSIIRNTRINKVLKMIVKLPHIPRDDEYQFRRRAVNILSKWKDVLGPEPASESSSKEKTNGVHKEDGREASAETGGKEEKAEGEAANGPASEEPPKEPEAEARTTEVKEPEAPKETEAPEESEAPKETEAPKEEEKKEGEAIA